jgi:hypothetical protein
MIMSVPATEMGVPTQVSALPCDRVAVRARDDAHAAVGLRARALALDGVAAHAGALAVLDARAAQDGAGAQRRELVFVDEIRMRDRASRERHREQRSHRPVSFR